MTRGLVSLFLLAGPTMAEVHLGGRVMNENEAPLAGAKLVFRHPESSQPVQIYTDPAGHYTVRLSGEEGFRVDIELLGYFPLRGQLLALTPGDNQVDFTLYRVREIVESLDVSAAPPPIDMDTTSSQDTLTSVHIINVPYPATNDLRNALRIIPGVVQDGRGGLHINGGAENQTLYTLNGFNITDPLTGRFDSRLSVEAVQTVDVVSGRYSAEYGKGSAGVLSINARTGDDTFRTTSTNFVPGFEYNRGIMIGGWTPRFNVSGPIKRGRAWFSNSADVQYVNTVIKELPRGQDQTTSWRFSNHVNTQVNLAPSNILYTGFLVNLFSAPLHGLSALDPPETTRDISRRQWFFHTKDQLYLTRDILVEAGYAANRTYGREMPQGNSIYQIMPDGMRGNFFVNSTQRASRDQFLVNTFLPTYTLAGEHRVKAGADLDRLTYWQDVRRTGYENFGQDCIRRRRTVFGGVGETALANSEASVYLHDSWRLRPNMLLELGGRGDWDRILHYWSVSPRAGVAWSPPRLSHTKLSGGYGMIYDATPLRVFMRPQDQHMLTTYYDPHGNVVRGPAVTAFTIQHFDPSRPRYRNYSLGWEQEWRPGVHTQVDFLRKRGNYGFTYVNILKPGGVAPPEWRERFRDLKFDSLYSLTNDRTDMFDSLRLTFRQVIRRKYEWMASYTRSRSLSNAVVDVNLDDPIVVDLNVGPMPWDSPNRFLTWGYLPTFREKWAVAYMLDWRTGFPFSIVSEDGRMAGRVNSFRLPDYFELNLHIERRFEFRKNIWAFRAGANNITNHSNPNLVNNNMSSTSFLRYYGGADRSFNVRLRWLGKLAQ